MLGATFRSSLGPRVHGVPKSIVTSACGHSLHVPPCPHLSTSTFLQISSKFPACHRLFSSISSLNVAATSPHSTSLSHSMLESEDSDDPITEVRSRIRPLEVSGHLPRSVRSEKRFSFTVVSILGHLPLSLMHASRLPCTLIELESYANLIAKISTKHYQEAALEHGINKLIFKRSMERFNDEFFLSFTPEMQQEFDGCRNSIDKTKLMHSKFIEFTEENYPKEIMTTKYIFQLTDLREPHDWYPAARSMKRKVIFHGGPTNSGKSYRAMQALAKAENGVYCGPLRLLALEGYEKLNALGAKCSLLTGDEQKEVEGATHVSCTVEMANTSAEWDVAVIDEIQMIGDEERGWAWTRALLGLRAREIHVCGEERAASIVRSLCEDVDEEFEFHRYDRLTSLQPLDHSLRGSLLNLRKGDCVVAFSRKEIFRLKFEIERVTKLKCNVVYGSLPPATRSAQAKMFNDPYSEYDVLVATDAIAFGLNLNIKRIVFSSMQKFNGTEVVDLDPQHIKQIAGRAGRYGTQFPEGEVTCLQDRDMRKLHSAMKYQPQPIDMVGLHPTFEQIEKFALQFPDRKLADLLDHFVDMARLDGMFFVCDFEDRKKIANHLHHIPLDLKDRFTFCLAPVDTDDAYSMNKLIEYAIAHSEGEEVRINIDLPNRAPRNLSELKTLESLNGVIEMYNWLSFRFFDSFTDALTADNLQLQCLEMIDEALLQLGRVSSPSQFLEEKGEDGTIRRRSVRGDDSDRQQKLAKIRKRREAMKQLALQMAEEAEGESKPRNSKSSSSFRSKTVVWDEEADQDFEELLRGGGISNDLFLNSPASRVVAGKSGIQSVSQELMKSRHSVVLKDGRIVSPSMSRQEQEYQEAEDSEIAQKERQLQTLKKIAKRQRQRSVRAMRREKDLFDQLDQLPMEVDYKIK